MVSDYRIFREICDSDRPVSRATVAAETGYSLMTVGKAVDRLEEAGLLVRDKRVGEDSPGRKASLYSVSKKAFVLAVDMTRRVYEAVMLTADGDIVEFEASDSAEEAVLTVVTKNGGRPGISVVVLPDDESEPVGLFPWGAADYILPLSMSDAWYEYSALVEKPTLYVGGSGKVYYITDSGKMKRFPKNEIEALVTLTGSIIGAAAALGIALSPGRIAADRNCVGGSFERELREIIPVPPEITVGSRGTRDALFGASWLAVYRYIAKLK